ncbi:hypothetical protein [Tropicimonas marinistellae]|uniref:hypothetical protein n=1 Tax=Tropicimonas marinistellae TaxID=1739787 RepID=UPI000836B06D|nr:hypothetical protein [Tropicimonas marinistellae]
MPREVRIRLNGPLAGGQKEQLPFDIDGTAVSMRFRVGELGRKQVTAVPEMVHDLLDIAATLYAADCNISRWRSVLQRLWL